MKKISKRKAAYFLAFGLFLTAFSKVVSHYVDLPDMVKGMFAGVGIGIMILSLLLAKWNTVSKDIF